MRTLVHSPAHLSIFIRTAKCPCSSWRPDLQYACPAWYFQADCGSVKGAEVLAKRAPNSEHYLPCWWIRDKFNHCQRKKTPNHYNSNSHCSFSSDGHEFGGMAPWPPLDPPLGRAMHTFHSCENRFDLRCMAVTMRLCMSQAKTISSVFLFVGELLGGALPYW